MANTNGGTTVSFGNTPQAKDDLFTSSQTGLAQNHLGIVYLDVLDNDLGGNAKSLWSVDNGTNNSGAMNGYIAGDLLTQDTVRAEAISADTSLHGARIWITNDGKVGYDASTLDSAFLAQGTPGQYLTDTFIYAIRLGNGTLSWATATVQIAVSTSQNHPAAIGDPTVHDVTEDLNVQSNNLVANGTISISDADAGQASFQTTVVSAAGNLGSLTLAANGGYTYSVANGAVQYLGATDTKTDSFTIKSVDGTTKVVSFTIHGANDAAVIGDPAVHDVTEDQNVQVGNLVASGTISISDADQNQASFQTTVVSATGNLGSLTLAANGGYTYSVANSAVQFLGATDIKTDSFTIKSVDGTTKVVSFTIHGANDAAVITEDLNVQSGNLVASGTLSVSDADQNQASFQTTVVSATGNLGSLTLAANGSYTYSVANSAVQFLGATDTKTETFTVTSADGTSKDVSFTIHGTNDAAVIGDPNVSAAIVVGNLADQSVGVFVSNSSGGFNPVTTYSTGGPNPFVAVGDVTGDGIPDIVTANDGVFYTTTGSSVSILAGDGHGGYLPAVTVATGNASEKSVALGDVNGDGVLDIVDANSTSSTADVITNDGNGGFTLLGTYATGGSLPYSMALGDITGDGILDLVTANDGSNDVSVLAGDGHGGFGPPTIFSVNASGPVDVDLADVNGDGRLDIITADQLTDSFSVLLNDGSGGFLPAVTTALGNAVVNTPTLALGDVNHDGFIDVVAADSYYGAISVFLGDGHGNFTPSGTFDAHQGFTPTDIELGDVNGDGNLDAVTANYQSNNVSVLLGDGHGGFAAPLTLTGVDSPWSVALMQGSQVGVTEGQNVNAAGRLTAAGVLPIADIDQNQSSFQTSVISANGNLGSLTLAANGSYTYSVANSAVQFLGATDTKTETFTVTSVDGTTKVVSFTIHGANNTALIGDPTVHDVTEDTAVGNLVASGTLSISDADQGQASFQTTVVSAPGNLGGLTLAANGGYTYSVANSAVQFLGATDTKTETFTVTSVDGTSKDVSFTIHGANDAPTITSGPQSGNVSEGDDGASKTAIGQITYNDVDLTDGHTYTVLGAATYGTASVDQNGNWSYTVGNSSNVNALAAGQHLGDAFTVQVSDGNGGFATQTVSIDIVGTNDAPSVSGAVSGSVTEDNTRLLTARGQLTSSDPDGGTPIWSIVGGATAAGFQDFRFQVDNLKIIKAGATLFEDTFGDNNPPPSTPGTSTGYGVQGTFTEAAGRAFFDGTATTTFGAVAYGERMQFNTDTTAVGTPGTGNNGLKRNADFSTEARFDLVIPQDGGDAYGVRLIDQTTISGNTVGNGDSSVDLVLLRDALGVHIQFRQINLVTSTATMLQQQDLSLPTSFDQITFKLSYLASSDQGTAIGGKITAAYDLMNNGAVTSSGSFAAQGTIFKGEDWTRVQLLGQSNQSETGVYKLAGVYGTLTVAQDGEWHYFLADQQANVQALTQGQQVTDNFTIRVSDGAGGVTDKPVSITVNGVNDVAIIGNPNVTDVTEDTNINGAGNLTASGTISISDVDTGQAAFQPGVTSAPGNLGTLTHAANGSYTYTVANSAVQFLGAGSLKGESFTIQSIDGTTKIVNFLIHGVNDAPVAQPDTGSVTEAGTLLNSDQVTVGFPAASGNVLLNDTDADNDFVSVSGLAAGATNSPLVGNINFAISGTYGALTMFSNGAWAYQLDNTNPLTNALTDGQHVTDVFTYTVIDGHGGSANQTVTINVTGTNDAPVGTQKLEVLEGSGAHQLDLLHGATDAEGNAIHVTNVSGMPGFISFGADGHTLTIDTSDPQLNSLAMGQFHFIDLNIGYDLVDSLGSVSHELATVRVVGTDDAPTINIQGGAALVEAGVFSSGNNHSQAIIDYRDPDVIGTDPFGHPAFQFVFPDTTGWTDNHNGTWSKVGVYGTATWNFQFLTYQLDNTDPDTIALKTGDVAYDTFTVTYTDGTLSTSASVPFEIDGRSDMSNSNMLYEFRYPTDIANPFSQTQSGVRIAFVTAGSVLDQITPTQSLNFGNFAIGETGGDGSIAFGRNVITFTFASDWTPQQGFNDAYMLRNGDVFIGEYNPANDDPNTHDDDVLSQVHINGAPFNGFILTGLPTIESVNVSGGPTANIGVTSNEIRVDFQNHVFSAGDTFSINLDFVPTLSVNAEVPSPAPVDVGASTQTIGPILEVYDGFTLDLNVDYAGAVHFGGPSGTLKFASQSFSGAVDNFLTNTEFLDFSAITHGNASIVGDISGSMLAAHSIGWVTTGTDTTVYVNASDQSETIAAGPSYSADLAVHLQNVMQLHSHDFIV